MTDWIPQPWEFALLAAAIFRLWHLIAEDTILDRPRAWLLGVPGWQPVGGETPPAGYREHLATFLTCPWCSGFWIGAIVWGLWLAWPTATVALAVPFALNAVVALTAKHLA